MPSLTLYRVNGSCALVPHAVLLHYGIPAKTIRMQNGPNSYEAADGSFTNAEYRRSVNPMGYVPALKVDQEVITEMPAILNYISALVPIQNLLGVQPLERARVAEWLAWLSGTLHSLGFAMFWRPYRFSDDKATYDSIRAKGMKIIEGAFERIDTRLKGREFAVGNALTAVDFNFYIFSRWGKEVGFDMEKTYPTYNLFATRLEGLEGIKKAVKEEGLEFSYI
ncbi:hypothetical protein G7046_g2601 [Stylonectria norvegica]|nr:hypothetical protein G7046_g2601 [Stylonectria norvegica]